MNTSINEISSVLELNKIQFYYSKIVRYLLFIIYIFLAGHFYVVLTSVVKHNPQKIVYSLDILIFLILLGTLYFAVKLYSVRKIVYEYKRIDLVTNHFLNEKNIEYCKNIVEEIKKKKAIFDVVLLNVLFEEQLAELNKWILELLYKKKVTELAASYNEESVKNNKKIEKDMAEHPLLKLEKDVDSVLKSIESYKVKNQIEWKIKYEKFSWWNKIKYANGPDYSKINNQINELRAIREKIKTKHATDLESVRRSYKLLEMTSRNRIKQSYDLAAKILEENRELELSPDKLLQKAFWCSTFSVSVSLWNDFNEVGNIYDALRNVNGKFLAMSDAEIWWESLWMSPDSLTGLASLTKGAYFEQLVARDTGGQLFEHFNHKDTDIIIDGVAVQLKATDSVSYIESVDANIPVITTSEVAEQTWMIDSGYSNEELSDSVDLALGGSVVDVGDTTIDALLAGVGGLGFFATINGINHAQQEYDNGMGGEKAIIEGLSSAVEGTAKGLVDATELASKVIMSRPLRFVGRILLKGFKNLAKF